MYKIICFTRIARGIGLSSEDAIMTKTIEIPFSPFAGLGLSTGDWSMTIFEVHYDAETKEIHCWEINERMTYYRSDEDFDELVKEHIKRGWSRET